MSGDDPTIASNAKFATELTALLRRAHEGGVDVEGGWECRNGDEAPDWDVVVAAMSMEAGSD